MSTGRASTSAYGPLFTLATYPLAWLSVGSSICVLKLERRGAALALAALVARLAPSRGVEPLRAAAFVGLNPLVLVHVVGGPHNDGAGDAARDARRRRPRSAPPRRPAAQPSSSPRESRPRAPSPRPSPCSGPAAPPAPSARGRGGLRAAGARRLAAFGLALARRRSGVAGENQGKTSHMSVPITARPPHRARQRHRPSRRLALYICELSSPTSSPGPGAAATGCGPPPGPRRPPPRHRLAPALVPDLAPSPAALSRDRPLQLLVLGLTAYQLGARIPL